MKIVRRILLVILLVIILAIGGFIVWATIPVDLMPEAEAALLSTSDVTVSTTPYLTFRPTQGDITTGFILYPGGKVSPEAYAPYGQAIAEQGYLVVIPAMPLQLAVFNPSAAVGVMEAFPDIQYWAVGGHSMGGRMAAKFAHGNPDALDGLVLWAAFPEPADTLTGFDHPVLLVSGSRDALATPAEIQAANVYLPADTVFVALDGGNHSQFGWYGMQEGDNPATLSYADQMAQTVTATVLLLSQISAE